MRAFATTSTLLLLAAVAAVNDTPNDESPKPKYIEPIVRRFVGALPESACQELIALGEEAGFTVDEESIDDDEKNYNVISQSIEVFERNEGVTSPNIWSALEPWIPKLTGLVKDSIDKTTDSKYFPNQPDRVPHLDWVFFRKYDPTTDRKSLKLHVDTNMHTLNIALNDDFQGGGLFYVKPPLDQEVENPSDDRPDIPNEYKNYEWLNKLQRKNTSDIIFPELGTGDVLVHNFTVWHAVAPIEVGARYSFVLFFDMDNPAIQEDFYYAVDTFPVSFYHEIEDMQIDLVFVDKTEDGKEILEVFEEKMPPYEEIYLDSYDGHVFRALISGTDTVVSEFVMREDRYMYTIIKGDANGDERNDEL